jgi:hypothetical protein
MNKSLTVAAVALAVLAGRAWGADGVTATQVKLGSVLVLKGPTAGLGTGMKTGMDAAFKGEKLLGREIELVTANDFYEGEKAAIETRRLIGEGVFVMIGNVGTPTAAATLPILKEANIPAVGFFTGSGLLRPGAGGPIVNYRASYVQETVTVIQQALDAGVTIGEVCAFVQNDAYGMAGLAGVKVSFERNGGDAEVIKTLDALIKMTGDNPARNELGPVGVYTRNDIEVRPGYKSLKDWEKKSHQKCRLVVTVGAYAPIAHFARVSRQSKEKWVISAVSFTGADNLLADLRKYKATDRFIMTQVVPLLDSTLPIVQEARQKLGKDLGFVSLEGYIVGRMFLRIAGGMQGEPTRDAFMKQVSQSHFDLGGIPIDFTKGNQGSNLIVTSYVTPKGFLAVTPEVVKKMAQ